MRNFFDSISGREWMVWCRQLSSIGERIDRFSPLSVEQQQLGLTEDVHLTSVLTAIIQGCAELRHQSNKLASAYNLNDLASLKREATQRRIAAVGISTRARSTNYGSAIYGPVYDSFRELADLQVRLWESVAEVAETVEAALGQSSRAGHNEITNTDLSDCDYSVTQCLELCESVGEVALAKIPELARKQAAAEEKRQRLIGVTFLTCIVVGIAVVIYFIAF